MIFQKELFGVKKMKKEPLKNKMLIIGLENVDELKKKILNQKYPHLIHYVLYDKEDVRAAVERLKSQITPITSGSGALIKINEAFPDIIKGEIK